MPWRRSTPAHVSSLQHEINRMFDDFFVPGTRFGSELAVTPALDIKEDEKSVIVTAELPGVESKDVHVSVHDNVLTIKGEKRSEKQEDKHNYHYVERSYGSFARRVMLPADVDSEHAKASMDKGVLTLELPKSKSPGAKTITIK
jgi:HSP20 family protein